MESTLSSRDVRALFHLEGELMEIAAHSSTAALSHLAASLPRLLGEVVMWWTVMRGPVESLASRVYGFDASTLRRWEQGYLLEGEYAEHPMWPGLFRSNGSAPLTRRREELVSDRDWYGSGHIAEWCRGLGFDDVLASVLPLGGDLGAETVGLTAVVRPWGEPRFSKRDADVLQVVQLRTRWLTQRALLAADREQLEVVRAALPPYLQLVHRQLLRGLSEKEIAAELGLSPRTVHKYVERIYAAFEVQSRAQLMALWVVTGLA